MSVEQRSEYRITVVELDSGYPKQEEASLLSTTF